MTYQIHSMHRGRFIWILLGSLFIAGGILSQTNLGEIAKILILLFCIPVMMFLGVKLSYQNCRWTLEDGTLHIEKGKEVFDIPLKEISYFKNHIRSGGNLLGIVRKKKATIRIWRNKLFSGADQYEDLLAGLRETGKEIVVG